MRNQQQLLATAEKACRFFGLALNELMKLDKNTAESQITSVYRKLALQYHSDKTGGTDADMKTLNATRDFIITHIIGNFDFIKNLMSTPQTTPVQATPHPSFEEESDENENETETSKQEKEVAFEQLTQKAAAHKISFASLQGAANRYLWEHFLDPNKAKIPLTNAQLLQLVTITNSTNSNAHAAKLALDDAIRFFQHQKILSTYFISVLLQLASDEIDAKNSHVQQTIQCKTSCIEGGIKKINSIMYSLEKLTIQSASNTSAPLFKPILVALTDLHNMLLNEKNYQGVEVTDAMIRSACDEVKTKCDVLPESHKIRWDITEAFATLLNGLALKITAALAVTPKP